MKTCPYCKTEHNNQEFSDFCDIDCAIGARREYDKACDLLDEIEMEKQRQRSRHI